MIQKCTFSLNKYDGFVGFLDVCIVEVQATGMDRSYFVYRLPNSLLTTFLPSVHSCLPYTLRICIFVHLGGNPGSSKGDDGTGMH